VIRLHEEHGDSVVKVSKHPDNPWWHQERDAPVMIMTRVEWENAAAAGHLTPEHVMQRLKNIADYAFDIETVAGFDEDGFVISLIAEGLPLSGGVKLYVYSNDHPPPHVHIKLSSHPDDKIRINLETGEYMDDAPRGLARKRLKGIQTAVRENHDVLASWWEKHHGDPVALG
jgi:hypothetical protein